jgi:hypothetical protein
MEAKSTTRSSFFQSFLDKYIYYVVINKSYRQSFEEYSKREMSGNMVNLYQA